MIIILENRIGEPSSIPGWSSLYVHFALKGKGMNPSFFPTSYE